MTGNNLEKTKICKNCNNLLTDKFCNHCGQEVFKRFNYSYLWQTIKSDLFDIDSGLLLTFKELWTRPGLLVLNYINGVRIKYYSPLKYLVFWTALYLLVIPFTTSTETDYSFQSVVYNAHEIISVEGLHDFGLFWYKLMTKVTNIYFISVIPFLAGASLLINQSKHFNFTEILISQTYFCGQFASVAIANTLLSKYFNPTVLGIRITDILILIPYCYLFIKMQRQFFSLTWAEAIWKSILTVLTGTFVYLIVLFIMFATLKYV